MIHTINWLDGEAIAERLSPAINAFLLVASDAEIQQMFGVADGVCVCEGLL
jgi:hypothetical protein